MIRCCVCRRAAGYARPDRGPTDLPGSGYRCIDRVGCRKRVKALVKAHTELAEVCEPQPIGDHPHNDPGDGRSECQTCGKWVWPFTHSCKGVPVTEVAMRRLEARIAEVRP